MIWKISQDNIHSQLATKVISWYVRMTRKWIGYEIGRMENWGDEWNYEEKWRVISPKFLEIEFHVINS